MSRRGSRIFSTADPDTGWPGVITGGLVFLSVFPGAWVYNRIRRDTRGFLQLLVFLHVCGYLLAAWSCWAVSFTGLIISAIYVDATQGTLYMHLFAGYLEWFRRWGKVGLGSGIIGCIIGLWPAVHSLLAEDWLGRMDLSSFLVRETLVVVTLALAGSLLWRTAAKRSGAAVSAVHLPWLMVLSQPRFWLYEFFCFASFFRALDCISSYKW